MNGIHEQGSIVAELADVKAGLAQLTGTVCDLSRRVSELADTLRGSGDGDGVMTRLRLLEARVALLEAEGQRRSGWVWQVAGVLGGGFGMWLLMRAVGG